MVLSTLRSAEGVVYGMGSLYTSIIPTLIAQGVGEAIESMPPEVPRILMLNGDHDRETAGMSAVQVVEAVTAALNQGRPDRLKLPASSYINTVYYPQGHTCVG